MAQLHLCCVEDWLECVEQASSPLLLIQDRVPPKYSGDPNYPPAHHQPDVTIIRIVLLTFVVKKLYSSPSSSSSSSSPPSSWLQNDLSTRIHQREMDSDDRKDIVVNHVHPGYVDTDMTRSKSLLQCKTKRQIQTRTDNRMHSAATRARWPSTEEPSPPSLPPFFLLAPRSAILQISKVFSMYWMQMSLSL